MAIAVGLLRTVAWMARALVQVLPILSLLLLPRQQPASTHELSASFAASARPSTFASARCSSRLMGGIAASQCACFHGREHVNVTQDALQGLQCKGSGYGRREQSRQMWRVMPAESTLLHLFF